MHCPFCGHTDTKVIDSRLAGEGRQIRRRRFVDGVVLLFAEEKQIARLHFFVADFGVRF